MIDLLKLIACAFASLFKSRARLEAEILILRHQSMILRRKVPPRRRLSIIDRLMFVWLYRATARRSGAVRWKRRLRQTGAAEGSAYIGPGVPHPTEVAAAAAFFGSPKASYVSGQHIGINGGGMAMLEPNMRMRRASPGQL
jgi:hypothetical protein